MFQARNTITLIATGALWSGARVRFRINFCRASAATDHPAALLLDAFDLDVRAGERLSLWVDGRWTFLDVTAVKDLDLRSDTLRVSAGVNFAF